MQYKTTIKKDGTVLTEVIDKGQHLCEDIYVSARAIGKITNDEDKIDDEAPVFVTTQDTSK